MQLPPTWPTASSSDIPSLPTSPSEQESDGVAQSGRRRIGTVPALSAPRLHHSSESPRYGKSKRLLTNASAPLSPTEPSSQTDGPSPPICSPPPPVPLCDVSDHRDGRSSCSSDQDAAPTVRNTQSDHREDGRVKAEAPSKRIQQKSGLLTVPPWRSYLRSSNKIALGGRLSRSAPTTDRPARPGDVSGEDGAASTSAASAGGVRFNDEVEVALFRGLKDTKLQHVEVVDNDGTAAVYYEEVVSWKEIVSGDDMQLNLCLPDIKISNMRTQRKEKRQKRRQQKDRQLRDSSSAEDASCHDSSADSEASSSSSANSCLHVSADFLASLLQLHRRGSDDSNGSDD
ncbi:unnamed protein product [Vitrella brassicaformis CCMP3155]|uniref:Uncharacterized protein n=1 Tax=Vitrella brassicaformis (strain CCMP3155) TaxID=1169540 RepID=A0A0G4H496_VITBC|nr:unnamed protein product [Vitrella brassicaformis CCMP3155]|eukprot:CEM38579.1 unnamed protein product [Vitrella brassicaformis CCMP3155]